MNFARWIENRRWMNNVGRARRFRDTLSFSERKLFDDMLRPQVPDEDNRVIAYPDAFYHVKIEDLMRAVYTIVHERRSRGMKLGDKE